MLLGLKERMRQERRCEGSKASCYRTDTSAARNCLHDSENHDLCHLSTSQHGARTQRIIVTAVEASNLTGFVAVP